jgi:hypothetical protein
MRAAGDNHQTVSNATPIAVAKARALQKLKPASGLHAETGGMARPGPSSFKCRRSRDLYQSGTDRTVPFRYALEAPRLNAAFVAQLLGQMMPDREQGRASVLTAYEDAPSSATVFDTRL